MKRETAKEFKRMLDQVDVPYREMTDMIVCKLDGYVTAVLEEDWDQIKKESRYPILYKSELDLDCLCEHTCDLKEKDEKANPPTGD